MSGSFDRSRAYIKKIGIFEPYAVWLVDGEYIRKEMDENFVEFEHNIHLPFIPHNELWIDHETHPRERRFFIENALTERTLVDEGTTEKDAHAKANRNEARERIHDLPESLRALRSKHEELVKRIHKDLLQEWSTDAVKIWLVNGTLVRDFFLIEYASGGHDHVYPFIPEGEIWIEDILSEQERTFIILHELHERFLMDGGKKYPEAHHGATIVEDYYRDHPAETEARIREELEKNALS